MMCVLCDECCLLPMMTRLIQQREGERDLQKEEGEGGEHCHRR